MTDTPTPTVTDAEVERVARAIWHAQWEEKWPREHSIEHAHAFEVARAAISAMTRSDDGLSRWQPIETAPKDQWLLTWDADGGHGILRHNDIFAMAGEEADGWMGATHWQPLPAPPKGIDHAEG